MKFKKISALLMAVALLSSCGKAPATKEEERVVRQISSDAVRIDLSDDGIKINDAAISESESETVYLSNDIVYYKNGTDFTYGEGVAADMHSEEEASSHSVVNITKPGDYVISGKLSKGQIAVDLGEEAEDDPNACVTLVLDGVDITSSVAPAIIFYNVYECGDDDEANATANVDTSGAGANIVIADGTTNTINGAYVAKIYKSVELNEAKTEVVDSKKLHKYDGALYSKMTMNIFGGEVGDGILNINAENEGIGTELHFTMYGGIININSGNDGINTNEDNVSVTTIKAGELNIIVNGKTGEGDGIDSNGWLIIEGGTVNAYACDKSMDSGIDADMGIALRGGKVVATGNMLDRVDEGEIYVTFMFSENQEGEKTYTLKSADGKKVLDFDTVNGFSQMIVSTTELTEGEYTLWCGDTQLAAAEGGMGSGRFPGGGGPRPDGEMRPPSGEAPQMPPDRGGAPDKEGFGGPGGKRPEGGMNGERPPMPEGEGFKGPMNGSMVRGELEFSEIFTIKKGSNSFLVGNKE